MARYRVVLAVAALLLPVEGKSRDGDGRLGDEHGIETDSSAGAAPTQRSRTLCAGQPPDLDEDLWYFGCWADAPSNTRSAFVCQRSARDANESEEIFESDNSSLVAPLVGGGGWVRHGDRLLQVFKSPSTFPDAESTCEEEGGQLAIVDSYEANVAVAKLCTADLLDGCFIGARRLRPAEEWHWVSNEALTYVSWFPEQPKPVGWSLSGDMFEVAIINWHHLPGADEGALQGLLGMASLVGTSVLACFLCCGCAPRGRPDRQEPELRPVDTTTITGLRAIASLAIATGHCFTQETTAKRLDFQGGFAVTVFLFISGFIMAVAYGGRSGQPGFDRQFLIRRAARLYPVHWLALLLSYPMLDPSVIPEKVRVPALVLGIPFNLMLVQSWWSPVLLVGGNGPAWTMSTQLFFYFAFGPLLRGLKRNWSVASSTCCSAFLSFCSISLPLVWFRLLLAVHTDPFGAYMGARAQPLVRLPLFVVGLIAGIRATEREQDSASELDAESGTAELLHSSTRSASLRSGRVADRLSCFVLLLWLSTVVLGWLAPSLQLRAGLELLCVPVLPWWVRSLTAAKGGVARHALTLHWVQVLGNWSFSLYLLQIPVWELTRFLVSGGSREPLSPVWAPLLMAEALAVAALCNRLVEDPCRKKLQRCCERPEAPQHALELVGEPSSMQEAFFTCTICGTVNKFLRLPLDSRVQLPVVCGRCSSQTASHG